MLKYRLCRNAYNTGRVLLATSDKVDGVPTIAVGSSNGAGGAGRDAQ